MTDRYDTISFMVAHYLVALNRERALQSGDMVLGTIFSIFGASEVIYRLPGRYIEMEHIAKFAAMVVQRAAYPVVDIQVLRPEYNEINQVVSAIIIRDVFFEALGNIGPHC